MPPSWKTNGSLPFIPPANIIIASFSCNSFAISNKKSNTNVVKKIKKNLKEVVVVEEVTEELVEELVEEEIMIQPKKKSIK